MTTTALERLDAELQTRQFPRVKPDTLAQVRRLCRNPGTGQEILYERLLLGCVVLDERETENRWELWELLLTAYGCCQDALDEYRQQAEQAEIERRRNDPERREQVRRLAVTNHRSTHAYLVRENGGPQVPPEDAGIRQPTIRKRKGSRNGR